MLLQISTHSRLRSGLERLTSPPTLMASLYLPSQSITTRRARGIWESSLAHVSRSPYCNSVVHSKMKTAASANDMSVVYWNGDAFLGDPKRTTSWPRD